MIAQVTLDLGTVVSGFKYLLAAGLLAIAVVTFLIPVIRDLFSQPATSSSITTNRTVASGPKLKRRDVDRSSDTPPPSGFAEHLRIIETAAPNADAKTWWEYAKAEMTEAEVALAEAKLARQPDPNRA